MAVFEVARLARPGSYTWRLVASAAPCARSSAGVDWPVQALPRGLGDLDLVMVIGGDGVDAACRDARLIAWLRRASRSGARIASICSGSLMLAAAGLLDDRTATTHWSRSRQFASDFPAVRLQPDRIYVREPAQQGITQRLPEVWTSAGMTVGIDLCLALVAHDHGQDVAREAARQLVVERRRPGGQSQFSPLLDLQRPEGRFGALLDHVRCHLHEDHASTTSLRACA
jgi:transcriptional regulator GlxA family with amidase domain